MDSCDLKIPRARGDCHEIVGRVHQVMQNSSLNLLFFYFKRVEEAVKLIVEIKNLFSFEREKILWSFIFEIV